MLETIIILEGVVILALVVHLRRLKKPKEVLVELKNDEARIITGNSTLDELVNSDKYKDSKYSIRKVNSRYALFNTKTKKYVDLKSHCYEWEYGGRFTMDCLGSLSSVVSAFNFKSPVIEKFNIEENY